MSKPQFHLTTKHPTEIYFGTGVLDVNEKTKEASFFAGDGSEASQLSAHMERATLDFAAAHVIKLSGFEPHGVGRDGKQKYRYQEWFLRYVNGGA